MGSVHVFAINVIDKWGFRWVVFMFFAINFIDKWGFRWAVVMFWPLTLLVNGDLGG